MYFITILVIVISSLLTWWYRRPSLSPPGPRGLPVVGVIPFMTRRPPVKFYEWSKTYGPIISVRVGRKDWIVLNTYDVICQGQNTVGRPANYAINVALENDNGGIVFSTDKMWEKSRKFGNATFRALGVGKRSFEKSVLGEAEFLMKNLKENENQSYKSRSIIFNSVTNVICRVLFGKRFEYDDALFLSSTNDMLSDPWKGMMFNMAFLLPFTIILPPVRSVLAEAKKSKNAGFKNFKQEIEKIKARLDPKKIENFIEAYLVEQIHEKEEYGENKYFTDTQLLHYLQDLFGAGGETSSSMILWCFLAFLHHPHCQDRIQSEIRDVIGNDKPSMEHRDSMPFTQAFMDEIQRYCTLAPLAVPHCGEKDFAINGFIVRKGVQIMFNIWGAHHDATIFENPREFNPERFLDENGNFVKSKFVIPFSLGPRHCLGEQLARMEIFLFLTTILQEFSIKPDTTATNELPGLDDGVLGTAYVAKPYTNIFVPLE